MYSQRTIIRIPRPSRATALLLCAALALAGCGDSDGAELAEPAGPQGIPVSIAQARAESVEVIEQSVGRIEAPRIPDVAAETAGRIRSIAVDAGARVEQGDTLALIDDEAQRLALESAEATVTRLRVLLENQQRTVDRLEQLTLERSVSQSLLDDAVAEARALQAQIAEADARRKEYSRALANTRVTSPIAGIVQSKHVSEGDYVTSGQPLFALVAFDRLRAYLPFPETLASRIRPGQPVSLTLPTRESETVEATVTEIRPMVGTGSSAIEAIVEFDNPGNWMPGASVRGQVITERHEDSVVLPESSVVQRPSGNVVYVVSDQTAHERVVDTGVRRSGWVEIRSGVDNGEPVVTDGAGFLTDGAPVRVL